MPALRWIFPLTPRHRLACFVVFLSPVTVAVICGAMYVGTLKSRSRSGNQDALKFTVTVALALAGPVTSAVMSVRPFHFVLQLFIAIGVALDLVVARTRVGTWHLGAIVVATLLWHGAGLVLFMNAALAT